VIAHAAIHNHTATNNSIVPHFKVQHSVFIVWLVTGEPPGVSYMGGYHMGTFFDHRETVAAAKTAEEFVDFADVLGHLHFSILTPTNNQNNMVNFTDLWLFEAFRFRFRADRQPSSYEKIHRLPTDVFCICGRALLALN
jgi:hypothetical protein